MVALQPRFLVSPAAQNVLRLLTPEYTPMTQAQRAGSVMQELERQHLVEFHWTGDILCVRLTLSGRAWNHSVNN